jgi:hypothetical protein
VVQQAALLDGLPLDAFALEEDRLSPAEVDVGRGEVLQAPVDAAVVVVVDEGRDLRLELAGQGVVLEQDAVLQRPAPALDLALFEDDGRGALMPLLPVRGPALW